MSRPPRGWLYLAAVLDPLLRAKVHSLRLGDRRPPADRPDPGGAGDGPDSPAGRPRGLPHHSDRGVQYARRCLSAKRWLGSWDRAEHEPDGQLLGQRGDRELLQHAWKRELVHHESYAGREESSPPFKLFEYIEVFYNQHARPFTPRSATGAQRRSRQVSTDPTERPPFVGKVRRHPSRRRATPGSASPAITVSGRPSASAGSPRPRQGPGPSTSSTCS